MKSGVKGGFAGRCFFNCATWPGCSLNGEMTGIFSVTEEGSWQKS